MPILGIETSCDETAAAVLDLDGTVLGHTVASQTDIQRVGRRCAQPAARASGEHSAHRGKTLRGPLPADDLSAIGVTLGPGLIATSSQRHVC